MTLFEAHHIIDKEARSDSSMHENYIHVLVAKMIVNSIFNEKENCIGCIYAYFDEETDEYCYSSSKEECSECYRSGWRDAYEKK